MTSPTPPASAAPGASLDADLAALEQRLASLLTYAKALRAANEALRRGLTAAEARNQALSERVAEAKRRLDALVGRLPEPAE
jgi:regulator of replication initiation timing